MDDTNQAKLLTGRGYCEQVKRLMAIYKTKKPTIDT
jgi:hypothetical protein